MSEQGEYIPVSWKQYFYEVFFISWLKRWQTCYYYFASMEEELPVDPFDFCVGEQEKWGKTWRKFGPLLLCSKFEDVQSNMRITTPARWRGDVLVVMLNKLGFNESNFDARDFLQMAPWAKIPGGVSESRPEDQCEKSVQEITDRVCGVFPSKNTSLDVLR